MIVIKKWFIEIIKIIKKNIKTIIKIIIGYCFKMSKSVHRLNFKINEAKKSMMCVKIFAISLKDDETYKSFTDNLSQAWKNSERCVFAYRVELNSLLIKMFVF